MIPLFLKCYTTWSEFLQAPVHKLLWNKYIYHSPLYVVVWPFLDMWHVFQVQSLSLLFGIYTNLTWFIICNWIEFTVSHHHLVQKRIINSLCSQCLIWLYKWQCMVWYIVGYPQVIASFCKRRNHPWVSDNGYGSYFQLRLL